MAAKFVAQPSADIIVRESYSVLCGTALSTQSRNDGGRNSGIKIQRPSSRRDILTILLKRTDHCFSLGIWPIGLNISPQRYPISEAGTSGRSHSIKSKYELNSRAKAIPEVGIGPRRSRMHRRPNDLDVFNSLREGSVLLQLKTCVGFGSVPPIEHIALVIQRSM